MIRDTCALAFIGLPRQQASYLPYAVGRGFHQQLFATLAKHSVPGQIQAVPGAAKTTHQLLGGAAPMGLSLIHI